MYSDQTGLRALSKRNGSSLSRLLFTLLGVVMVNEKIIVGFKCGRFCSEKCRHYARRCTVVHNLLCEMTHEKSSWATLSNLPFQGRWLSLF